MPLSYEQNGKAIIAYSDARMSLSFEDYHSVLDACIPSEEMRAFLSKEIVSKATIGQIIRDAPISLYKKASLLEYLASKENILQDLLDMIERQSLLASHHFSYVVMFVIENSFFFQRKTIQKAIDVLEQSGDGVFNLIEKWYDDELLDEKSSSGAPFLSMSKALEYIRDDMEECDFDETTTGWYELEKWVLESDDDLVLRYTYTFIGDVPVFCFEHKPYGSKKPLGWRALDYPTGLLDIPLPCDVGDIVTIDCLPFAPPKPALIIEGPKPDSCYPQMLSRNQRGKWNIDSLKQAYFSNGAAGTFLALSPCYKLRIHDEPLTGDEEILHEVQGWLRANPGRGRALWEAGYEAGIYELSPEDLRRLMKVVETDE